MLKTWIRYCTPECRNIVREVLSSHPAGNDGVCIQEIYELALKKFPDARGPAPPEKFYPPNARGRGGKIPMPVPQPPNRDHPIRSMRYLKRVVLQEMSETDEVEKVHVWRKTTNEDGINALESWLWRLKSPRDMTNKTENGDIRIPRYLPDPSTRNPEKRYNEARDLEYGSRKPPRGQPWKKPVQPRFHMSWGLQWKGRGGERSIHSASILHSQLNLKGLSSPRHYHTHGRGNERLSLSDGEHIAQEEEEYFGLRRGWNGGNRNSSASPVIDQLPKQNFDQPRVDISLDGSGSFGLRRAHSDRTVVHRNSIASRATDQPPVQHSGQDQRNTASFDSSDTGSFGLRVNKFRPDSMASRSYPSRSFESSPRQRFDSPREETSLDDSRPFGLRRALPERKAESPGSFASPEQRRQHLDKPLGGAGAYSSPDNLGVPTDRQHGHDIATPTLNPDQPLDQVQERLPSGSEINQGSELAMSPDSPGFRTALHRSTHRPSLRHPVRQSISSGRRNDRFGLDRRGSSGHAQSERHSTEAEQPPRQRSDQPRDGTSREQESFGLRRSFAACVARPPQDLHPSLPLDLAHLQSAASRGGRSGHAWEEATLKLPLGASATDVPPASRRPRWHHESDDPAPPSSQQELPETGASFNSPARQQDLPITRDVSHLQSPTGKYGSQDDLNSRSRPKPSPRLDTSAGASPRKPEIPFSERLRQSRMAITEQVTNQRESHSRPIQSAIGRLPQFRSYQIPYRQPAGGFGAAQTLFGPPIIRAVAETPNQRPVGAQSDNGLSSPQPQSFSPAPSPRYPSFPISAPHTQIKNDTISESKYKSA